MSGVFSRSVYFLSDVQENANPSNQRIFARAFTCSCICFLMCIKCLQSNDKKCIAIYYHVQKEVVPLQNNKTHVIELWGLGNLVASWVHRVLFRLIVCFVCFKVLRLSQFVLVKFYCPVNNILSCQAVIEYKKIVAGGGGGGKKGVRTQEREKLNVEEGQKRHVLRAYPCPDTKNKIHRAFASSTHHVNKPM